MLLKKVLAGALAVTMAAGTLTGCGSKGEAEEGKQSIKKPSSTLSDEETATVPKDDYESGVEVQKDAIRFTYALGNAPATIDAANYFKKLVEQKSNGAMSVDVYTDNSLGSERELVEGCQFGNYDIVLATNTPLASFLDDMYVLDLPWLFDTKEDAYRVIDGEVGDRLAKRFEEEKGLKVLQWQENSFRCLSTTDRPVTKPSDLKGLKIRIMENDVQLATWKLYGANPTPMAFTELFTALQQGTVDGQDNGAELTWQTKFCEVQKYFIETHHVYSFYLILMSMISWDKLTPEQQAIVMEASKEANAYERERATMYEQAASQNIDKVPSTEFSSLTPEAKEEFRKACEPVFEMVKSKITSQDLLDLLLKEVGME